MFKKTFILILIIFSTFYTINTNSNTIKEVDIPYSEYIPKFEKEPIYSWISKVNKNLPKEDILKIMGLVYYYSDINDLDPYLVFSMIKQESGYKTSSISVANARGLMQVIPYWHHKKIANRDLHDPEIGVEVGSSVLSDFITWARGDVRKALVGYSGGATNYANILLNDTKYLHTRVNGYINSIPKEIYFKEIYNPPSMLESIQMLAYYNLDARNELKDGFRESIDGFKTKFIKSLIDELEYSKMHLNTLTKG
jgi:hypothetical protein